MSREKAVKYLSKFALDARICVLEGNAATVESAAKAIGCSSKQIVKTLGFLVKEKPILILISGSYKVNNAKYKAQFGVRPKMMPFPDVETIVGHAPGGVCPFGINSGIEVYLDSSIKNEDVIYPAAGDEYSVIKLTREELEKVSNFTTYIDVCEKIE